MIQREHIFQRYLKTWVRDCVAVDHLFMSFDSAGKATENQRARAAARGVLAGTPDTVLHVAGKPAIYAELKAPGGKLSDAQERLGKKLTALGCQWFCVNSVRSYGVWLIALDIPLVTNAGYQAMHADAKIEAAIAKAEAKEAAAKGAAVDGKPAKKRTRTTKPPPRYLVRKRVASRAARAGIRL